jgi:hypothetical protein
MAVATATMTTMKMKRRNPKMNETKIPLKTDEDYYNKHDFVQVDESMEELTVEITLAEFRSLIADQIRQQCRITELKSQLTAVVTENDKLKQQLEIANG